MKKRITAFLLCLVFAVSGLNCAFAAESSAKLYSIYDDDMLFKQNEEAVFVGMAAPGSTITAELFAESEVPHAFGVSQTASDGTFSVSFEAPEGGFTEYTVVLCENGVEFERLERVVFGELWLASGQSNMQYPLAQENSALGDFAVAARKSKWIRVMISSHYATNGIVPVEPCKDIPDADWITGEDVMVYSASAVGYFFAEKLMEKLDMPVGVLNISLGGTSIGTWLSREAIDSDEKVKQAYIENGQYIGVEDWDASNVNYSTDMTVNYNLRIEAVKHFKISGLIWYQGETDIISQWGVQRYADAFDLLQRSYTQLFGYSDGNLPIVFTQLAPYYYFSYWDIPEMNSGFASIQASSPADRALVTIYDIPMTYLPEAGSIHPAHKKEIADRMAYTAFNMLYGGEGVSSAAKPVSTQIKDASVYVTFNNIGDTLAFKGAVPGGFAVCGEDGVYVQAKAEIVSADTVRIYADEIKNPVSASYGYFMGTYQSNLWSSVGGELVLPVSGFVTDSTCSEQLWTEKPWADCEMSEIRHFNNDREKTNANTPVPAWLSDKAVVTYSAADSYSGEKGLNIKADGTMFSISPYTGVKNNLKYTPFYDSETDYSRFSSVSFYVRNNGTEDIRFEGVRFYKDSALWYAPESSETAEPQVTVPADGEWHAITLDMNRLCLWGNECGVIYPNDVLDSVEEIRFCFSGKDAQLSFDSVRFGAMAEDSGVRFEARIDQADNFFEVISAVFVSVIGAIISMFNK